LDESINGWLEDYENEYGYNSEWTDKPADGFPQYFQSKVQSGDAPELVDTGRGKHIQYANDGLYAPLEELAGDYLDNFNQSLIESSKINDTLYWIPYYFVSTGTMYKNEWFDAAGISEPPTTTDGYFDAAETIVNETDAEYGLMVMRYYYALWAFFWSEGIEVLTDDQTAAAFNTDRAVEIVSRFREFTDDGVMPDLTWTNRSQPQAQEFGTGNTGMLYMWLSAVRLVTGAGDWISEDTVDFTVPPGKKGSISVHGWSIPESKNQATREQAMNMIKIITNNKWQKDFLRNTTVLVGNTQANEELAQNEEFRADNPMLAKTYDLWFEIADEARLQPNVAESSEIWDAINSEISAAALGEKDPEQAVNDAESAVNSTLQ